jgi:hypothetical protein
VEDLLPGHDDGVVAVVETLEEDPPGGKLLGRRQGRPDRGAGEVAHGVGMLSAGAGRVSAAGQAVDGAGCRVERWPL